MGPAGSQLLMWLAAWLTPLRCWKNGKILWPQATTEVGRMPPPSRAFLLFVFRSPVGTGPGFPVLQAGCLALPQGLRLGPSVGSVGGGWFRTASDI